MESTMYETRTTIVRNGHTRGTVQPVRIVLDMLDINYGDLFYFIFFCCCSDFLNGRKRKSPWYCSCTVQYSTFLMIRGSKATGTYLLPCFRPLINFWSFFRQQ